MVKSVRLDSPFLESAVGNLELVGCSSVDRALYDLPITSGPVAKYFHFSLAARSGRRSASWREIIALWSLLFSPNFTLAFLRGCVSSLSTSLAAVEISALRPCARSGMTVICHHVLQVICKC